MGTGRFDGLVGFPAVEVGPGVRVAEAGKIVREHGVEDSRVHRRGGLHVEVEGSSGYFYAFYRDS